MLHMDLEAVFVGSHDNQGSPHNYCLPHAIMLPKCDSVEQLLEVIPMHVYTYAHTFLHTHMHIHIA